MIKIAVVGLGKMGLSHLAIVNAHPDVELVGGLRLVGLRARRAQEVHRRRRPTATSTRCCASCDLDAVLIATPSQLPRDDGPGRARARPARLLREAVHAQRVPTREELTALARERGLVTQVGYHNRFVGAFAEVKRLLDAGGDRRRSPTSSARPTGRSCSSPRAAPGAAARSEGGGALYDYAAHPIEPPELVPRRADRRRRHRPATRSSPARSTTRCYSTLYYRRRASSARSRSTGPTSPTAR